jgi:hypothetical protein
MRLKLEAAKVVGRWVSEKNLVMVETGIIVSNDINKIFPLD